MGFSVTSQPSMCRINPSVRVRVRVRVIMANGHTIRSGRLVWVSAFAQGLSLKKLGEFFQFS